ncbi:MAG TPA: hypothetical protein VNE62_00285 [Actinomycetota bacterium]|nr:hypothetical protein [Actinomycetota bacterium]
MNEMIDERLDSLLRRARPEDPSDDGFTDSVMRRVSRQDRGHPRFGRAAAIAMATVVMAAGAAAAMRSTPPASAPKATSAPALSAPSLPGSPLPDPRRAVGAVRREVEDRARDAGILPTPSGSPSRDGRLDHGYSSPHTAWVQHPSGLRLETETHANEHSGAHPLRVTLSLENRSSSPLKVWTYTDCPVGAMALLHDRSSPAREFQCTAPEQSPDHSFSMGPGQRLSFDVQLDPRQPGNWEVIGGCACGTEQAPVWTPAPRPTPMDQRDPQRSPSLDPFPTKPPPTYRPAPSPDDSSRGPGGLRTPPIRLVVR